MTTTILLPLENLRPETWTQEATSVPLQAAGKMHQVFIQAPAGLAPQSLATQRRSMCQQEERLRAQQTISAQLASSDGAVTLRNLCAQDPQYPAFTGRTDHFLPWLLEISRLSLSSNTPSCRWEKPFCEGAEAEVHDAHR